MADFFRRSQLLQAARILGACALADAGCELIGLREVYWALVTAVVVTQPAFADTLGASRDRVLGTLIGALAGLAVIVAREWGGPPLVLFWIALVPLSALTALKPNLRLACITLIIVVLVPTTGNPFALPFERIVGILTGTMAAILAAAPIPRRLKPSDDGAAHDPE